MIIGINTLCKGSAYTICELVKDGQVRVYCFFDKGRIIILTNGDIKKKKKADPGELKKAKKLRNAYKAYLEKTS
jgi:hypothetical protein